MKSKNKKGKLISVSLLALCFSMLAFGVYALKQATLTVGGTVGFKAHDCMVTVNATIQGDAVVNGEPDPDGTPSAERQYFVEQQLGRTVGTQSVTLTEANNDIDAVYFSDLTETGVPHEILITFTVENDSFYPITATITSNLQSEVVTAEIETATITLQASGEEGDEGTLTIAYNLGQTNGDYVDLDSLTYGIGLNFAKVGAQVNPQPVAQDLDYNNLPQTHAELITALQNAGYTITAQQEDAYNNGYMVGASKNGLVYQFEVFDLDVEYENGAESAAQTMYSNMHSNMVSNGATDGVNGVVYYAYMADPNQGGQQDPQEPQQTQQNDPEIDLHNLPQNLSEFNALFANSGYNTGTENAIDHTAEEWQATGYPATMVAWAQAGNDSHAYQFMFFDNEGDQESFYTQNSAMVATYYPIAAADGVTILTGIDGTQPYVDMTTLPQTMEGIAALHNSNSGPYTNSIQQAAVKGGEGWNDAYVPEGAEGFLNATRVHGMLSKVTQNYNWMVFDTEAHMLAYKAMAEANMPEGYSLYGESGVVLCAFSYTVQSNSNPQPQQPETPKEYAGEPVITYYEAPNDDKMHTRQITYYNDSELTEVSYITLETFDTDGETLLTTRTSWPSYNKQTGDLEFDKFEIKDANKVMVEAGQLNYDSNHDITYKYWRYYTNGNITSSYEYNYQESLNYYDETNQQDVNNYAGYVVTARIADNNNATRVVYYLTQDPTALVTDSAKIDHINDQYLEYNTVTYSDVEVDGKNIPMESSNTILITDLNDTFRSKQSTSYTYVVDNNQPCVKSETIRTYDSSDNVLDKKVHTYTTHQGDSNNREVTHQGYIGESTLRYTTVFTTDGQADSETYYKNGVVSRTITRVKNGDQTVSCTERYYQNENLQYRLEITYENKEEVKTWYNAQNEVIADPELDVENDY